MRAPRLLTALVATAAVAMFHGYPVAAIEGLETPASSLRVDLDRLLSEHVFLTVQAMHAGLVDDDQFAAAAEALESNTGDLEAAIGGVYGEDGLRRFGDLWRQHIGYVVDYTRARAADDREAEQRARDGMEAYQDDFAAFLAGANPNLTEEAVHHLLDDHLEQLRQVADLQSGDYAAVYDAARVSYAHMFDLGDALSRAIAEQFPDAYPGARTAFGPAFDLRIAIDRLLGEHAFLAIEVMRQAGADEGADLAASEALASNGESLESAIADIYGDEAGSTFADMWEQHNGYYIDLVRALLTGDEAAQDRARDGLREFSQQATDFFASASDLISAEAVRSGLDAHTEHLATQVEAFAAGDYVTAFMIGRDAYRHMGAISDVLATGIVYQFPERYLPDTALPVEVDAEAAGRGYWVVAAAVAALTLAVASRMARRARRVR